MNRAAYIDEAKSQDKGTEHRVPSATQNSAEHPSLAQPYNDFMTAARPVQEGYAEADGAADNQPRVNTSRPSAQRQVCGKCHRHITGQRVRALGDIYHLECFTCKVRAPIPSPPC